MSQEVTLERSEENGFSEGLEHGLEGSGGRKGVGRTLKQKDGRGRFLL